MEFGIKPIAAAVLALVVSLVLWLVYQHGMDAGRAEVKAEWQAEQIEQARMRADAAMKARWREQDLQSTIDQLRGDHHETVKRITLERDAVVRELRRRAERPANYVPPAATAAGAESAPSCSGDQLWRNDAEFLAGLAAAADTVRASLTECRAAYDAAKGVN